VYSGLELHCFSVPQIFPVMGCRFPAVAGHFPGEFLPIVDQRASFGKTGEYFPGTAEVAWDRLVGKTSAFSGVQLHVLKLI